MTVNNGFKELAYSMRRWERSQTDRVFAHILGGSRIEASGLEGNTGQSILGHLSSVLGEVGQEIPEEIITQINRCQEWCQALSNSKGVDSVIEEMAQELQGLGVGESRLLPGGWKGSPGHFMLYEVTKREGGTYRLRIINSGRGLRFHPRRYVSGNHSGNHCGKYSNLLAITYDKIPSQELFEGKGKSTFFQALIGLQDPSVEQTGEQTGEIDEKIYQGILKPLAPFRDDRELISKQEYWITPQRSGICTWKASKAYLRLHLGDMAAYKKISLKIKIATLKEYYVLCQGQKSWTEGELNLLEIGQQNLARYFSKHGNSSTDKETIELLHEVNAFVKEKREKGKNTIQNLTLKDASHLPNIEGQPDCFNEYKGRVTNRVLNLDLCPKGTKVTGDNALEITKKFVDKQLYNYSNATWKPFGFYLIEEFASHIDLSQEAWKDTSSFDTISKLFNWYQKQTVSESHSTTPRQVTTALTLYFVLWNMLLNSPTNKDAFKNKEVKRLIARLVPPDTLFDQIDQNPFFVTLEPSELERLEQLKKAFKELHSRQMNQGDTPLDIFRSIEKSKTVEPNTTDSELLFYNQYQSFVSDQTKKEAGIDGYRADEQTGILASFHKDEIWEKTWPEFLKLRSVHYALLFFIKSAPVTHRHYTSTKDGVKISCNTHGNDFIHHSQYGYLVNDGSAPVLFSALEEESLKRNKEGVALGSLEQQEARPLVELKSAKNAKLAREDQLFLKACASMSTERSLQLVNLLALFTQFGSRLKRAEYRHLFITQFFKTLPSKAHTLTQEFEKNPQILEQAINFADQLEKIALEQGGKPDIELAFFASFVLQQIVQYVPAPPQELLDKLARQKALIDESIQTLGQENGQENGQEKQDTEKQDLLRLAHLHRLHFYATAEKARRPSLQELSEIFGSYFALSTFKAPKNNPYRFLEERVRPFVFEQIMFDGLNLNDLGVLATQIVHDCGFPLKNVVIETLDEKKGQLIGKHEGKEVVFNLSTGDVFYNGYCLKRDGALNRLSPGYQELFGDQHYSVTKVGSTSYLDHPAGIFRVSENKVGKNKVGKNKVGKNEKFFFQPHREQKWYAFEKAGDFQKRAQHIPASLSQGYQHFYDVENKEWIFVKDREYTSFDSALRWRSREKAKRLCANHSDNAYGLAKCVELERIMCPEGIEALFDEKQQCREIRLPFYDLTFEVDPQTRQLQWQEDKQFILKKTNGAEPLDHISTTLVLENKLGVKKVIVPHLVIGEAKGLESKATLATPKNVSAAGKKGDGSYDVYLLSTDEQQKTVLKPTSQEGTLALAYYRLHERRYSEALTLLKEISLFDEFSERSKEALIALAMYGKKECHKSPEASAISLYAWLLLLRKQRATDPFCVFSTGIDGVNPLIDIDAIVSVLYKNYLSEAPKISINLQLKDEDRRCLLKALSIRETRNYLNAFENGFTAPKVIPIGSLFPKGASISVPYYFQEYIDATIPLKTYAPFLSTSSSVISQVDFACCYEAIRQGSHSLKEIERWLWIKQTGEKKGTMSIQLRALFVCLEAKKGGKILPLIPHACGDEDVYKLTNAFNDELSAVLRGVCYKVPQAPAHEHQYPKEASSKQVEKKEHFALPSLDLNKFIEDRALHKKIGLSDCLLQENISLPLSSIKSPKEKDPLYGTCITSEVKSVNQELECGKERLEQERALLEQAKTWFLGKEGAQHVEESLEKLEKYVKDKEKEVKALKEELLTRANEIQEKSWGRIAHLELRKLAKQTPFLTIDQIERGFLWGDMTFLVKANPAFKEEKFVKEVGDLLARYEISAIELREGSAAKKSAHAIKEQKKGYEKEATKLFESLNRSLSHLKKSKVLTSLELLIFSRRSQLLPREDQLNNVEDLHKDSCILQKIMGGGKTSVIAAIWAFLMSKGTKLPVIFAESSLYQSLGDNLKKNQKTAFGQEIFALDLNHNQLGKKEFLDKALQDLEQGLKDKQVLVMCPETLQMLDLELQRLIEENSGDHREKIELIRGILTFFKTKAATLGDEIDLLLRADFEVNLPLGEKVPLKVERIGLVKEIFTVLVENKALKALIKLDQGQQGLLTKKDFKEALPLLAKELIQCPQLKLECADLEVKEAFIDFLCKEKNGLIPQVLRKHVDLLKGGEDPTDQEAAELIALSYHIIRDLLPTLFKQSAGQHFGRSFTGIPGKVVPYIGVDTPSQREFGYHYEAICKHMMTAVGQGIALSQLESLRDHFLERATRECMLKACSFQETDVCKDFKELVGIDLFAATDDKQLQGALEFLNADPVKALQIEAETAHLCVSYYRKHYHSSAQALPNLVDTLRGMTGTPWNQEGYNPKIGDAVSDKGAEGKILYTLLERAEQTPIYSLKAPSIEDLLTQATANKLPMPDAILDMGALFKQEQTKDVAENYLKYALEQESGKKAVLFFFRKKGEKVNNRLAVGRFINKQFKIELLESTRPEALKSKGLLPDDCVVFYDQRHTTGTDIPLPDHARALMTVDENIELRSTLQTVMRLREYCTTQRVDFAMLEGCKKFVSGQIADQKPLCVESLLSFALVNQAQKKADSLFCSLKQQIDEVFIDAYRKCRREGKAPVEIQQCFKEFVISTLGDCPYEQFFQDVDYQDSLDALEAYGKKRCEQFKKAMEKTKFEGLDLKTQVEAVVVHATELKKQGLLMDKVLEQTGAIGQEVQAEEQNVQEQHVDVQVEEEVVQELKQEIELYQSKSDLNWAEEVKWWKGGRSPKESVTDFIAPIQRALIEKSPINHKSGVVSLPELFAQPLAQPLYKKGRKFGEIFSENIFVTKMMQYSKTELLPVFHQSQKLVEQVLIVKVGEEYAFVILAAKEASFLKEQLAKEPREDLFLVHASGRSLVNSHTKLDLENDKVGKGLTQVNIFGGRTSSIEDIPSGAIHFLMWFSSSLGTRKDREAYLTLRSMNRSNLDHPFRLLKNIASDSIIGLKHQANHIPSSEIPTIKEPVAIFQFTQDHIPYITKEQLPWIRPQYLKCLTTPELIKHVSLDRLDYLDPAQYEHLTKEQGLYLQHLSINKLRALPKKWIATIRGEDLTEENIPFFKKLSEEQLRSLPKLPLEKIWWLRGFVSKSFLLSQCIRDKDIRKLETKEEISLLSKEQLHRLESTQIAQVEHARIRHLAPEQLGDLKGVQIAQVERERISHLKSEQLGDLAQNQIPSVCVEKTRYLSRHMVDYFTKEQVYHATYWQVAHMRIKQVVSMGCSQRLSYLFSQMLIGLPLLLEDMYRSGPFQYSLFRCLVSGPIAVCEQSGKRLNRFLRGTA